MAQRQSPTLVRLESTLRIIDNERERRHTRETGPGEYV